jgi:uncharacterized protein YndB with AHSA1/START domain
LFWKIWKQHTLNKKWLIGRLCSLYGSRILLPTGLQLIMTQVVSEVVIMVDIIHRIGIKSQRAHVYNALTTLKGLAGWWTEAVTGDARVGGKIEFSFLTKSGELLGRMVMEVQEADENKDVRWRCVDGPEEWVGTDITFQLSEQDGQIIVLFGHRNWREAVEATAHCSMKWATFMLSLRDYVETGKGKPSPNDLKIDNWN